MARYKVKVQPLNGQMFEEEFEEALEPEELAKRLGQEGVVWHQSDGVVEYFPPHNIRSVEVREIAP
jgi:hypothetical protein